jgi:hypothetical protein
MQFNHVYTRLMVVVFGCVALCVAGYSAAEPAQPAAPAAEGRSQEELDVLMTDMLINMVAASEKITDYTVSFTKQEYVDKKMRALETTFMKHKRSPHCVYMKWVKDPFKDRETIYCEGKYKNEIQAHAGSGIASWVGKVSLDPKGSMAMKGNRHPILDAGIWHTIGLIKKDYGTGHKSAANRATYDRYWTTKVQGQPSYCVFVTHPKDTSIGFYAYKAEICVHQQLYIPTSVKIWDFTDRMVESYTYSNYKINVGLTDADFDHENKEYKY